MTEDSKRRREIFDFVNSEYSVSPEYLWEGDFDTAVFRHRDTKKWFGIIMTVKRSTLGLEEPGTVEVMNVKCDPLLVDMLTQQRGYLRAYHMNKRLWISMLIDSLDFGEICGMIEQSFKLTYKKAGAKGHGNRVQKDDRK